MEDAHDAVSVLRRRPARGERDGRTGGDDTENQTSHLASLPFAVGCGSPRNCPEQRFFNRGARQGRGKWAQVPPVPPATEVRRSPPRHHFMLRPPPILRPPA